jgi:hypothetical protein
MPAPRARYYAPRRFFSLLLLLGVLPILAVGQTIPASNPDGQSVPVHVSDFELAAQGPNGRVSVPATGEAGKPEVAGGSNAAGTATVFQDFDAPSVQARKLMDFFSLTLTQVLQRAGFEAERLGGGRPESGVMLRGVFAEVDPMSRVRKAVLGSASTSTKFTLYVGTFNLARADEPLYQLAPVQSPDARFGPVITLNNYVPMDKFDLSKNPTEEDVRKICGQIVSNLAGLLKANPSAFAH